METWNKRELVLVNDGPSNSRVRGNQGKTNPELTPTFGYSRKSYLAVMCSRCPLRNRQSQAGSLIFVGPSWVHPIESIKHFRQVLGRNARSEEHTSELQSHLN